jgi:hypothetical protein
VPNTAQNGVITGGQGQPREQALAWQSANHISDQPNDFADPVCLTTVSARNPRQPLTEILWGHDVLKQRTVDGRP